MKKAWVVRLLMVGALMGVAGLAQAAEEATNVKASDSKAKQGWHLVWSDEFNSPNGSKVDTKKWSYEKGGDGWGNNELEYYTDSAKNSFIQDGNLIIRAVKEEYGGRHYTSARLVTHNKFGHKYGRFEARIKIPKGQGIWPAFWMMGENMDSVSWPQCGEIDIMENIGKEPSTAYGTLHAPKGHGDAIASFSKGYTLPSKQELWKDYHVYAVEWDQDKVKFFVDNNNYHTVTKQQVLQAKGQWVFDQPFSMLLNVAVGGDWPGSPDKTSVFPQSMYVDYVRVYDKN